MKLKKFWILTRPTHNSTIEDIVFETDIEGLYMQIAGGLTCEEIIGIYVEDTEAFKDGYLMIMSARHNIH